MDSEYKIQLILEAQNKMSGELSKVQSQMQSLGGTTKTTMGGMQGAMTALIGVGGFLGLKNALNSCVVAAKEQATVNRQLEATLKSTGGAVGLTSSEIQNMATQMSMQLGIQDEVIQSAQNMLLTFTNIGKDIFPQATSAVLDMATAMNGGVAPGAEQLRATSIQLGKALQDPILGMTALRRVGVNFSAENKKTVEAMLKNNDLMSAQKFILKELTKEFGGSAQAQATASAKLSVALGELKETIGKAIVPMINAFKEAITPLIINLTKWIEANPQLAKTIIVIVSAISALLAIMAILAPIITAVGAAFGTLALPIIGIVAGLAALTIGVVAIINAFGGFGKSATRLKDEISDTDSAMTLLTARFNNGEISADKYQKKMDELKKKQADLNSQLTMAEKSAWNYHDALVALAKVKMSGNANEYKAQRDKFIADAKAAYELAGALLALYQAQNMFSAQSMIQKQTGFTIGLDFSAGLKKQQADAQSVMTNPDKAVSDMVKQLNALKNLGAGVGSTAKETTDNFAVLIQKLTDMGYTTEYVTFITKEYKKASKDTLEQVGNYRQTVKERVQDTFDGINDKIREGANKIMDYQKEIFDLNSDIANIGKSEKTDIASQYVQAQKDLEAVNKEMLDNSAEMAKKKSDYDAKVNTDSQKKALQAQIDLLDAQAKGVDTKYARMSGKEYAKSLEMLDIENKKKAIQDQIANLTPTEAFVEDYTKQNELLLKQKELQDNINSAFKGISEDERIALEAKIKQAQEYDKLTGIEKIRADAQAQREEIQKEIDLKTEQMNTEITAMNGFMAQRQKLEDNYRNKLVIDHAKEITMYDELIIKAKELANYKAYTNLVNASTTTVKKRASGGPVDRGMPYIVGEKRPELFVPDSNGTIIPNLNSVKGNAINITVGSMVIREEADVKKVASALARMIEKKRLYGLN